jgi:hypothetical protein
MKVVDCRTLSQVCELMLDGEPCFLIRAQDKISLQALEHYYDLAFNAQGKNLSRVREVKDRFRQWQKENPKKVKVPD